MPTKSVKVGMPSALLLEDFGYQVYCAFGSYPYVVGSALQAKQWRDVDVRLLLDDETYQAMGLGDPEQPHQNSKWIALVLAFSALGKQMTGLPIDFQIQQQSNANLFFPHARSALGITRHFRELREAKAGLSEIENTKLQEQIGYLHQSNDHLSAEVAALRTALLGLFKASDTYRQLVAGEDCGCVSDLSIHKSVSADLQQWHDTARMILNLRPSGFVVAPEAKG